MSTDSQFFGGLRATKSISGTRYSSSGGITSISAVGLNTASSGSLSAGVFSTVLSRSNSAGFLHHFTAYTNDATSRDMSLKITIDGVVVFNDTYSSISASGTGYLISGVRSESSAARMPLLTWTNSILIEWASSLTESAKFTTQYMYEELQ
jgi:hypothetical protein